MRILLIITAALALCSCGSKNASVSASDRPSGNQNSETSEKTKPAAGTIVLDQIEQQKGHVVVEPVHAKDVPVALTVPGRLTFSEDRTWRVGAIATGRVEDLRALLGDSVRADQLLGHIHSHEVHEARAGYEQAMVELDRARSTEAYAKERRDRAQRLFDLKAGSRQDLETAEVELQNAQAAIAKARSELEKERAHLAIFRIPLDPPGAERQRAEEDDIPIFAPASGLVVERKATVGSVVNVGEELFAISDTSTLWMIGAANETDLAELHPGQLVHLQVRAYPGREFTARVLKLGEQLDPATRTLQIRIAVPNPQGLLKPEMYATANVRQTGRSSALYLPDEAIQDIDGVPVVFVRRGQNDFEARTIKTGQHVEGETEILEGLRPGEAVAVMGSFLLKSQMLKSAIQDN
jgi:multidrug efflux pump subunit AcrA (membrane-fusion protein)